jgi:hypothetical protein
MYPGVRLLVGRGGGGPVREYRNDPKTITEAIMLNEGIVINDSAVLVKSELLRQLWRLKRTTPNGLERAVFEALTGGKREDIDWSVEDNKAGYFTWIKTFDVLIGELVEDGYLTVEREDEGRVLVATAKEPDLGISQVAHPSPSES